MSQAAAAPSEGVELNGGVGKSVNSARAGYLPIPLMRAPLNAFDGIAVYVRAARLKGEGEGDGAAAAEEGAEEFQLYCAPGKEFTAEKRALLAENGVQFLYIRMTDHGRFKQQVSEHLEESARDPNVATSEKAALVYETSIELVNELLADPESMPSSPALQQITRSVTTLVLDNEDAFAHLLAVSHHDFYTATHVVNVATWMAPLAYELGHTDPKTLDSICRAGLLHDLGKLQIPDEILNKTDTLTDEEWATIREHPETGYQQLSQHDGVDEIALRVTREHHERLDGRGYPHQLRGDDIHEISRICAVVDSFDAMTAFRPYKEKTMGISQVMEILRSEAPEKYDERVIAAWDRLLGRAEELRLAPDTRSDASGDVSGKPSSGSRRRHERKEFTAPGRLDPVFPFTPTGERRCSAEVTIHNISPAGVGVLCRIPIDPGEDVRILLKVPGWDHRRFEGQVVRCREFDNEWFEIGIQLTRVMN